MTAMHVPPITKKQSKKLSQNDNSDPNIFKCAAAGKMTLTIIVQINPTREQSRLNDGTNIATNKAAPINVSLITEDTNSMTLSFVTNGAIISSKPRANGNAVRVNLEKAVNIISQVSAFPC